MVAASRCSIGSAVVFFYGGLDVSRQHANDGCLSVGRISKTIDNLVTEAERKSQGYPDYTVNKSFRYKRACHGYFTIANKQFLIELEGAKLLTFGEKSPSITLKCTQHYATKIKFAQANTCLYICKRILA
jgi:hypothetical protein